MSVNIENDMSTLSADRLIIVNNSLLLPCEITDNVVKQMIVFAMSFIAVIRYKSCKKIVFTDNINVSIVSVYECSTKW